MKLHDNHGPLSATLRRCWLWRLWLRGSNVFRMTRLHDYGAMCGHLTIEKQCWERKFKISMRQFDGKNVTQSHLFQKNMKLGGYGFEISYSGTPAFHTFAQEMPLRLFVEGCMHRTFGPHLYPLGWVRFLKNAFGHFVDSTLAWLPKRCHLAKATSIKITGRKVMGWVFQIRCRPTWSRNLLALLLPLRRVRLCSHVLEKNCSQPSRAYKGKQAPHVNDLTFSEGKWTLGILMCFFLDPPHELNLRQASDTCRGSNAATFAAYREDIACCDCREGIEADRVGIFLGTEHDAMKPVKPFAQCFRRQWNAEASWIQKPVNTWWQEWADSRILTWTIL